MTDRARHICEKASAADFAKVTEKGGDIMAKYILTESCKILENGEKTAVYGIAVKEKESGEALICEDLSCDREAVSKLVALCNEAELQTVHFYDVVNDFLVFKY